MTDENLIKLYWERDKSAIKETKDKYGKYLFKIAYNILSDYEDSEESVNDTYFKIWNRIPPQRPESFTAFIAKIIRENSIDILRKSKRKMRKSEYITAISELEELALEKDTPESVSDMEELAEAISRFLREQTNENRTIFVQRYFYLDSLKAVSSHLGLSEAKIKSSLFRMRKKLKIYLEEEGFYI